jgi:glycosyltransferase involved in cell wall biosynthesis
VNPTGLDQAPRIAVVIPCYNDGETLPETVASARDQEPCELVVVDDGSTDEQTGRVLEGLSRDGVRVVRQENRGLSAARMTGVEATSARYVNPVDADDLLVPGSLTALADALDESPDLAAAWGDTASFGDVEVAYERRESRLDPWRITYFNGLPYCAMFRRAALHDAGGWTLRRGYEDWDLWMALAERGYSGKHVRIPVLRYRVHGQRFWAEAMSRHESIYGELQRRHSALFANRRVNWRRSPEPWRVKAVIPLAGAFPRLSPAWRRRLYLVADNPKEALQLTRSRLRRARS